MKITSSRTVLVVAIVLLAVGFAGGQVVHRALTTGQPLRPVIKWEATAKGFVGKRELTTYRAFAGQRIGQEKAQSMLQKLQKAAGTKLDFDREVEADGRFVFTSAADPSAVFDIDTATGAFLFNSGLKDYSAEGSTRGLPTEKEAPGIARKYLAELGQLPKREQELVVARVGGLAMAAAKDGKSSKPYHKLVTVFFGRVLGDLPVQGRGSRLLVHLGERSAVVGLIRAWSEVEPRKVDPARVKNDERIRKEITRRLVHMAGEADEVVVRKVQLVLFDDGRGVIEPAMYVLASARYKGPEKGEGAVHIPVDFYVPVLFDAEGYYPFRQDAEAKWPGADAEG